MKTMLSYLLTPLFHLYYGLMLGLFHPIMVLSLFLFGDRARKKAVDILNLCLIDGLYLLGCSVKFSGFDKIPEGRPLIIVSNHQSMYDIPPVVWGFRKYYPRFISKIELSKNLPSISHNLKHGKSALIDRQNVTQSVKEIFKLGRLIDETNTAACIFPEGTRSKTGKLKEFMPAGISTLLRAAPSAIIVPFVINGHYQMMQRGYYPMKIGQRITYTVLDPVEPEGQPVDDLVKQVQRDIEQSLKKNLCPE